MARFGYFLSGEEHAPGELVRQARLAERAGFEALWISDHFHPWLDEQGQSSFAWAVIGALSQATSLAGRIADGYICMMPDADLVKVFRDAGGAGRQAEGVLGVRRGAGAADRAAAVGQRLPAGRGEPAAAAAAAVPPAGAAGDRGRVRHADRARAGRLLRLLLPRGAVAPTRMTPYSHGETPGWKE